MEKTMERKWMFIICPEKRDEMNVIHWNVSDEDIDINNFSNYAEEHLTQFGVHKAYRIITDREIENIIYQDDETRENVSIIKADNFVFVDGGYMARAVHLPSGKAYYVTSDSIENMISEAYLEMEEE